MITLVKLKIYSNYNGDIDMWTRTGKSKEKLLMEPSDWYLISSLIQDIFIVKSGTASEGFIINLNKRLSESCENEETIRQLKKMN